MVEFIARWYSDHTVPQKAPAKHMEDSFHKIANLLLPLGAENSGPHAQKLSLDRVFRGQLPCNRPLRYYHRGRVGPRVSGGL